MIEVEVPELGIVEFPDDTTPQVMEDTLSRHFKREELGQEMKQARVAGQFGKVNENLIDAAERVAYTTSLMHPLKAIRPFVNPYGYSVVPPEAALTAIQSIGGPAEKGTALEGAQQFAAEMISGLGQMENIPAFAAGVPAISRVLPPGTMPLVGRTFQTEMIGSMPQQIQQVQEAQTTPEAVKAALGLGATGAMVGGIEYGISGKKGVPNAESIRASEGQLREAGVQPQGIQETGGDVVERAPQTKEPVVEGTGGQAQGEVLLKPTKRPTKLKPGFIRLWRGGPEGQEGQWFSDSKEVAEFHFENNAYDKNATLSYVDIPESKALEFSEAAFAHPDVISGKTIAEGGDHVLPKELTDQAIVVKRKKAEHPVSEAKPSLLPQETAKRLLSAEEEIALSSVPEFLSKLYRKYIAERNASDAWYGQNPAPDRGPRAGTIESPLTGQAHEAAKIRWTSREAWDAESKRQQAKAEAAGKEFLETNTVRNYAGTETDPKRALLKVAKKLQSKTGNQIAKPSPVAQETAPVEPAPTGGIGESSKGVVEPTSATPPPATTTDKLIQSKEQVAQPEVVGMGGAVPGEFALGQGSPTAMKYRLIDEERLKRGEPPLAKPPGKKAQELMDQAMAALDRDPSLAERLVTELNAKPRVIEDWENHVLLLRKIDLREEYYRAARRAAQAYEDSKQFPERIVDMESANAQASHWSNLLTELETASRLSGSKRGSALQSLQVMANEDYSLAALEIRARQARGWRELKPDERAELVKIADEHRLKSEQLANRVAELESLNARKDAEIELEKLKGQTTASPYVIKLAESIVGQLDKRADAARARIRERMGRMSAGVDPTVLLDLAEIGASHIGHVGLDFVKWSDQFVKDVGEWARPHLDEVFSKSKELVDNAVKVSAPKKVSGQVKTAVTKAEPTVDTFVGKIEKRLAKDPKADIGFYARRIARILIQSGERDREALIDKVHSVLANVKPDLTRRETMDIISGYGDYTRLTKDDISVVLRDLSGQMQQIAKLEDMASGEAPLRTGQERRTPSDEERRLIAQVNEAKKKGGYQVTDPEAQLRTALDAVKKRLENQIKDLELQIQTRTKIVKERTPTPDDAQTKSLRARRDELKAQYDEIFNQPMTEAERLAAWKERTIERTQELREMLAGTRERKAKRKPVELDKEALRLRFELHTIERLVREKEAAATRAQWGTVKKVIAGGGEVLNASRALLTSYDLSAPLRQGIFIGGGHPVRAAKVMPEMFRALFSDKQAFRIAEEIRNRDNAPLYETSGLYLAEHGGRLSRMEEAYMSRWAEKIPGVRASQRAYTAFLNKLRADSFDAMVKGLTVDGKGNPAELKAIANYINVATGRGSVPWNQAAVGLNTIFFAPRFVASRFQLLSGQPMFKGTMRTRRMIAMEYGRFLAGAAVVYALGRAAGGDIETDPRSSDFGKIKLGETRLDPMAGLLQVTVLAKRLWSGETKSLKGQVTPIRGKVPYGKPDAKDIVTNFLRGKLSPGLGNGVSLYLGEDVTGKPFEASDLAKNMAMPISWQDIKSAIEDQGVPRGTALGLLSIFGAGVNVYEPRR